jgi:hypothetical protein
MYGPLNVKYSNLVTMEVDESSLTFKIFILEGLLRCVNTCSVFGAK